MSLDIYTQRMVTDNQVHIISQLDNTKNDIVNIFLFIFCFLEFMLGGSMICEVLIINLQSQGLILILFKNIFPSFTSFILFILYCFYLMSNLMTQVSEIPVISMDLPVELTLRGFVHFRADYLSHPYSLQQCHCFYPKQEWNLKARTRGEARKHFYIVYF